MLRGVVKKVLGVILIILGIFALITPLTPGSWLAIVGLELLGLRVLFQEKIDPHIRLLKGYVNKLIMGGNQYGLKVFIAVVLFLLLTLLGYFVLYKLK